MRTIDELMQELRLEAEVLVRKEYEDRITALEAQLKYSQGMLTETDRRALEWEKEAKVYQDKYIRLANAIETLNDTL